jgi:hypothetical protein
MAVSTRSIDRAPLIAALAIGGAVAASAALLQGVQIVLPLAALAAAVLALFQRRIALYILLPAMTLSPDISFHGLAVRVEDLLMLPLAAGWVAHVCVAGRRRTPLDRLLIAYALVAVVATGWGAYIGTVHLATVSKYVSSPFHVLKRIEFVFIFFVVADTVRTLRDVRALSYWLLGSAVALSLYSVQQLEANGSIALGPEGAPIHEPGFASMVTVALALGMMQGASRAGRLLLGALVVIGVATLPLALGRNYMVATLLVAGYVALRKERWMFLVLPLLGGAAMAVYPHGIVQRILSLSSLLSTSTSGVLIGATTSAGLLYRSEAPLYYATIALGHSPFFGFGMGSVPLGSIDSEYVIQLYYTGLVGLAIFLLFGTRLFRLARQARVAATDPMDAAVGYSFQLMLTGYAIYSVFAGSISPTHTGGPFFVVVGLVAALWAAASASPARKPAPPVPAEPLPGMRQAPPPRLAARRALWARNPLLERRAAP